MAKRYVHIGSDAHREAVAALDPVAGSKSGTNEGGQSRTANSEPLRVTAALNATDFRIIADPRDPRDLLITTA